MPIILILVTSIICVLVVGLFYSVPVRIVIFLFEEFEELVRTVSNASRFTLLKVMQNFWGPTRCINIPILFL